MIWITVNSVAQALLIEVFFIGPVLRHPRLIVRVLLHVRDPNTTILMFLYQAIDTLTPSIYNIVLLNVIVLYT